MHARIMTALLMCAMAAPAAAFDLDFNKILKAVQNVKQATTDVTEPQEIELGAGIASTLLGAAPLLQDASVQRYVNNVGRWLALQTERPDLPWQFAVLDDPDINAFAVPGGPGGSSRPCRSPRTSSFSIPSLMAAAARQILRETKFSPRRGDSWL